MLTIKRKKQLTYVTIGFFFFLGGIEYAVILPTIWLYLSERFNAPSYFLGLVLSAISVADLLASPVIGRLSDTSRNTKVIVLVANIPQCLGSFMYFMGLSPWFLVASRFVVGLGSAASVSLFADIARVTTEKERTSVFSIILACRQLGLLLGPGCNLFLMHVDFKIGSFQVDSYSIPGLFMALLWIIHEIFTFFMFWNLPSLHLQEQVEQSGNFRRSSSEYYIPEADAIRSRLPSINPTPINTHVNCDFEFSQVLVSDLTQQAVTSSPSSPIPASALFDSDVSSNLTSSNDYMEVAEQYMGGRTVTHRQNSAPFVDPDALNNVSQLSRPLSAGAIPRDSQPGNTSLHYYGTFCADPLVDGRPQNPSHLQGSNEEAVANGVVMNSTSVPEADFASRFTLSYYAAEFIRHPIVAILSTVFVAFFNQLAFETMVTPLTNKFLGWKELENSILYFGAGLEVIAVLLILYPLSRRVKDRPIILFGFLLETLTIAFFLWFVPQAKENDFTHNLPLMLAGIFVDLLGLPMLVVTSSSLYSKITREETQGFAQGIRRVFGQCGTILGPLWASSMLNRPYWMFGVMLGVNIFSTCLLLLSYGQLSENNTQRVEENPQTEETEPLLRS